MLVRSLRPTFSAFLVAALVLVGCQGCTGGDGDDDDDDDDDATTLTFLDYFGAVVPVTILVHDASGALLHELPGDADGVTSLPDLAPESIVTAVQRRDSGPFPDAQWLVTFVGVQPGDTLFAYGLPIAASPAPTPIGTVEFEAEAIPGAVNVYFAIDGCPAANSSVDDDSGVGSRIVTAGCIRSTGLRAYAVASAEDFSVMGYAIGPTLTEAELFSGPIVFPAWSTALTAVNGTLTNIPAEAVYLNAGVSRVNLYGSPISSDEAAFDPPGTSETAALEIFPFDSEFTTFYVGYRSAGSESTSLERRVAGTPVSFSMDVGADVWPLPAAPVLALAGSSLSFTFGAAQADANRVEVSASWNSDAGSTNWTFLLPPDSVAPLLSVTLPDTLGSARPTRATGPISGQVEYYGDSLTWDEVRNYYTVAPGAPVPPPVEVGPDEIRVSQSSATPIDP